VQCCLPVWSLKAGSTGEFDAVVEDPGGEAGVVVALECLGGEGVQLDVIVGRSPLQGRLGRGILTI
jgi:hypothetical protein